MAEAADDDDESHRFRQTPEVGSRSLGSGSPTRSPFTDVGVICETVARSAGVDGAAVAVFAPSSSRELVYATDALAQHVDELQFTLGEGPCLDAYHEYAPQLCPRLDTGAELNRWPAFCDGAAELGVQAVFAFPVPGARRALGVLELYRRTAGEMDAGQRQWASVCAVAIGETLLANWQESAADASDVAAPDSGHQFSRAMVYVASGMVAVQLGVSADEGLDLMRAYCFSEGRSIIEVADDIVARRLSLRGLQDDQRGQ
jgi:hypothetical protein